jgi:hypothetical protein
MNAPAKIISVETDRHRQARRELEMRLPRTTDFELECRVDIVLMRDHAWAGMVRACPSAATLLCQAARIATEWAYTDATPKELMNTRSALRQTIDAARALERAKVDG